MDPSGYFSLATSNYYSFEHDGTPSTSGSAEFERFSQNILRHGGQRGIEAFSRFEEELNLQAGSDNRSDVSGALSTAWRELETMLYNFLSKFWADIEPCEIGVDHRFTFSDDSTFLGYTHEYRMLSQARFNVGQPQRLSVLQVSALHAIKLISTLISDKHDLETDVDRYRVHCTRWYCYYQGSDFVVEFRLDM